MEAFESYGEVKQTAGGEKLKKLLPLARKRLMDAGKMFGVFHAEFIESTGYDPLTDTYSLKFKILSSEEVKF